MRLTLCRMLKFINDFLAIKIKYTVTIIIFYIYSSMVFLVYTKNHYNNNTIPICAKQSNSFKETTPSIYTIYSTRLTTILKLC